MYIDLAEVKDHIRVDGEAEDALIGTYAAAAMEYVRAFTNRDWPDEIPASVKAAILLLVGDLYENRLAQSEAKLTENRTVDRLLWPHRVFT
jgi:uncharacterized phage protein (predicted DNA packaging)